MCKRHVFAVHSVSHKVHLTSVRILLHALLASEIITPKVWPAGILAFMCIDTLSRRCFLCMSVSLSIQSTSSVGLRPWISHTHTIPEKPRTIVAHCTVPLDKKWCILSQVETRNKHASNRNPWGEYTGDVLMLTEFLQGLSNGQNWHILFTIRTRHRSKQFCSYYASM